MKWTIGLIAGVLLVLGYLLWRTEDPVVVEVQVVGTGLVEQTVANTRAGTIKACRRSRLSMPVGGQVAALLVNEGDRVLKGDVLLTLWNADRLARLEQSRATLLAADMKQQQVCLSAGHDHREIERVKQLFAKRLTSEEHLDRVNTKAETSAAACHAAQAESQVAAANIKVHEALLDQTRLLAPFDGIVVEINGEVGEYVTPSPPGVPTPPAVDLVDLTCLFVTAPIDEVDASLLKLGLPTRITLDAFRGQSFTGRVRRIAPYVLDLEKQARTVDAEVVFDTPPLNQLLVGYSSDIEVIIDSRDDVVRIPTESITEGDKVWLDDNGVAKQQQIEKGLHNWNFTEVVSGLKPGDKLITSFKAPHLEVGQLVDSGNKAH